MKAKCSQNAALGSLRWFSLWLLSMLGGVLLSGQSVPNMLVGFLLHVDGLAGGSELVALSSLEGHHDNIHAHTLGTLLDHLCVYLYRMAEHHVHTHDSLGSIHSMEPIG